MLMSLAFLIACIAVRPDPAALLAGLVPRIPEGGLFTAIALIGTTIVPYNLFLHAAAARERWSADEDPAEMRLETIVSIGIGALVSIAILITAAASGVGGGIGNAADIARQVQPVYGPLARYAIGAGLFGAGLNLQARLQSAPVLIVFAALFTLFALAMFGVFNLRLSSGLGSRIDAWQARAQRSGPLGLALAGALSVLVVSPCVSAPLAGALVFISSTGDAVIGGAALLALALLAIVQQLVLRLWNRHRFAVPLTHWWLMGAGGLLVGGIGPVSVWKTLTGRGWTWKGRELA